MRLTRLSICLLAFSIIGVGQPVPTTGQSATRQVMLKSVSAIVVESQTRKLGDGNVITNSTTGSFLRDQQGRTRIEKGNLVFINDPVARNTVVLDTTAKTVQYIDQSKNTYPTLGVVKTPGAPTVSASEKPPLGQKAGIAVAQPIDLGSKVLAGVAVTGKRFVSTVPAGLVGNLMPIQRVSEIWGSKELALPVYTITSDPIAGEYVQEYSNIVIDAPIDPASFSVPPGFRPATAQ